VSDARIANLSFCDHVECVDLMGTPTDDGAIAALAGKKKLRRLKTGRNVTDLGILLLPPDTCFQDLARRRDALRPMSIDLPSRGFTAVTAVLTLRGLAVSSKRVDDAALAMLPRFPAVSTYAGVWQSVSSSIVAARVVTR
jgi:hypothetical protein